MDFLSPECAGSSVGPANGLLSSFFTTMIALHCNISTSIPWPKDYGPKALENGLDDYDFVVVGAGSAGSVVAARLAENRNHKVLLIEAGGDPPIDSEIPGLAFAMMNSAVDWSYPVDTNGQACLGYKQCLWSKGKVLGGSHAINAMVYLRGNSRDYDTWAELGNYGWEWNKVLDYFKKSEKFRGYDETEEHGRDGPMNVEPFRLPRNDARTVITGARELGYHIIDDFVAGNYLGFGKLYGTLIDGRRMSTAKAFLTKNQPNLHVIKHAIANQVVIDSKKRARAVRFVYDNEYKFTANAKKEVILCAGSIETPKLLMLSGVGPADDLKDLNIPVVQNLRVGDNLLDHLRISFFIKLDRTSKLSPQKEGLDAFYQQWVHRSGPLGGVGLDITGFLDTDRNGYYPDIQFLFSPIADLRQAVAGADEGIVSSFIRQVGPNERVLGVTVILLQPKSIGYLRLKSKNYLDKPLIYPNYLDNEEDFETIIRGIRRLLELEDTNSFRKLNAEFLRPNLPKCDYLAYKSDEYWKCYIKYMSNTIYHYAGTTKMGPRSDKTSVVSPDLKVYGVKGLRVIDAGVMPTLVSANINPAVIMVAEKGADLVKSDWR